MNRLWRLLKHRLLDEADARRALDAAAQARLTAEVARSEALHSGEIRICVEAGLPLSYLWRGASARERAVALFGKLRVWDTEHNNGVLIYLLLAERRIEIVADRGLVRRAGEDALEAMLPPMAAAFVQRRFEAGLQQALDAVHGLLQQHFPLATGSSSNANELPNALVML